MNSTKDELSAEIEIMGQLGYELRTATKDHKQIRRFEPISKQLHNVSIQFASDLVALVAERERLASQKAIDYFYWRIDCSTLISELEGWRGCIDMAKHQTEEHLSALQPSNKEGK